MIEEIADLIVQGRNREAYEKLRDQYGLSTWDVRERQIAALMTRVEQVDHDVLASRHNRALKKMFPPPKKEYARFQRR